ncbi:MAG TPA: hypothetical protein PKC43_02505 [Phycisphaerales bacterium]|nr:hypothetical protein [Phycisphaerales bacterium]HMP36297.1 hypothetical protein [Phycisphaerales bacterium]
MVCRLHHPDTADGAPGPRARGTAGAEAAGAAGIGGAGPAAPGGASRQSRLTLLVSASDRASDWRQQPVAEQLPALLRPMGVECVRVSSGDEATEVVQRITVHVAVVDLTIPLRPGDDGSARCGEAGTRLLQLLRRLASPPPTIVIRPPQPSLRESARTLSDALREGAFAVLDRPVQMEALLEALRRLVRRHYRDHWPATLGQPLGRV